VILAIRLPDPRMRKSIKSLMETTASRLPLLERGESRKGKLEFVQRNSRISRMRFSSGILVLSPCHLTATGFMETLSSSLNAELTA
jgi:hypothetical protein